uniref:Uncharacterized protein n=1 Tax=Brassica campestris TaxID=3711 RepID=M4CQB9_BRACM
MDIGPCPKVHSLQLRKEYKEAKAKGVDNYDRELEDAIDRLIVECDRKIGRALKRLQEEDAKAAIAISVTEVTQSPDILELSKQIKEKMKEADLHDQRRGAESENQVKRVTEEIAVTVVEILTVEVEIVTGIMTTVNMTDTITSHVGMTQEAGAVRVPGLGKDQEIMIAADAMTATKMLQEMVAARGRYRCV